MRYVGVDGCKAGWLAITRDGMDFEWRIASNIDRLIHEFSDADRMLIDIPIGLPWTSAPIRSCDRLARELLGSPRRSSVFPVPCRDALAAEDLVTAQRINKSCLGRSIGAQTWGISPKIAEVDGFLRSELARCRTIREIHPELCFWALAGRKPMAYRKTTPEGREERLRVLQNYEPAIEELFSKVLSQTKRKEVQPDDVLDAAAAFITAEGRHGKLTSLCAPPRHDLAGLSIEMVYLRTWAMSPNLSSNGRAEAASRHDVRPRKMTASSRKGKHEIACEFLSRAIELYLRGDSDFSALHLAGAAEEVFSVMVRELPTVVNAARKPSLDEMKDAIVALSAPGTPQEAQDIEQWAYRRMTAVKNSIKHMRGLKDVGVSVDIREEAQDVIDRAISTYFQLASRVGLPLVKEIEEFDARVRTGAA